MKYWVMAKVDDECCEMSGEYAVVDKYGSKEEALAEYRELKRDRLGQRVFIIEGKVVKAVKAEAERKS